MDRSWLSPLVSKNAKFLSIADVPAECTTTGILVETRHIWGLILDETVRVDNLPEAFPGVLDALSLRELAPRLLSRDELEPMSDELEAGHRPCLLLGDHVLIKRFYLLGRTIERDSRDFWIQPLGKLPARGT